MDGQEEELAAEAPLVVAEGEPAGGERGGFVRDRTHRFPGRRNALKVLYDDLEVASVRAAAQLAGLTPTGFVTAAGLTLAGSGVPPASSADRALLAELLQGRTALQPVRGEPQPGRRRPQQRRRSAGLAAAGGQRLRPRQ